MYCGGYGWGIGETETDRDSLASLDGVLRGSLLADDI